MDIIPCHCLIWCINNTFLVHIDGGFPWPFVPPINRYLKWPLIWWYQKMYGINSIASVYVYLIYGRFVTCIYLIYGRFMACICMYIYVYIIITIIIVIVIIIYTYIYIYIYIYMYVFLYESGWIEPSGSKSLYFVFFFACGIWMYANGISFHPGRSIVIRKWKLACWTAKDNRWAPPAPDTDGLLLSKQLDIAGHFDKVQFQI